MMIKTIKKQKTKREMALSSLFVNDIKIQLIKKTFS